MRNWAIIAGRRLISRFAFTLVASALFLGTQIISALPAQAAQSIPYKINFQGRLTDQSGNILANGTYNIKFRLFDALTVGVNKWEEDRVFGGVDNRITVTNGLFNVQFGDVTGLTPALFSGIYPLYLEVELPTPATATCASNGCASFTEGAMTPRQPLASSPYAFNADTLDGLDSSALVQLTPAGQQTGSINVSGNIQTAAALQGSTATLSSAGSLTVGTANSATGSIAFKSSGSANTVTLTVGATAANYALNLPLTAPGISQCLQTDSVTAAQLVFGACSGATGANAALSNLVSVAINSSLVPGVNNSIDTGSAALGFRSGYFATSVLTARVDSISAGPLTVGDTFASSIALGKTSSNIATTINGTALVKPTVGNDSTTAFQVQNAGAVAILTVDTVGAQLNVNGSGTFTGTVGMPGGVGSTPGFHFTSAGSVNSYGSSIGFGLDTSFNIVAAVSTAGFRIQNSVGNTPWLADNNGNTIQSGNLTVRGNGLFQNTTNATNALQVQNAFGAPIFVVDTTTNNIITNPGFEVDVSGWVGVTATLARNTTSGQYYAGYSSNTVNVTTNGGGAQATSFISAVAPGTYAFSFEAMRGTNTGVLGVTVTGGTAPVCALASGGTVATGFQRYTCSFTSTATNVTAITVTSSLTGTFYLDAVQLTTAANNLNNYDIGNVQLRGVVNTPATFQGTSNSTTAFQIQGNGGANLFTVDSLNKNVIVGSSITDATQVLLQLDSFNTFLDTGACSTTTNQGALYYNTSSNAIRSCISGAWEDVVTTAGLGIMIFGIVPDSGVSPGDLASLQTAGATGPCKVSATSGTVIAWTACTAFSGGRKVIVAAGTTSPSVAAGYDHVCLNTTGVVTVTNGAAETTNLATVSWNAANIGNSYVCLADLKVSGTAITAVYDTRAFTTSQKEFVTATAGIQNGVIVIPSGTGVTLPGLVTAAQTVRGVVIASNGAAVAGGVPNAIIVVSGPTTVKATAGTAATVVTQGITTNGYAITGGAATLTYSQLGVSRKTFPVTACTTTANAANCDMSLFFNMNLR